MRLEKIVLDGFKSFADRTEFTFESPITAIVGPNGCGKSNIVDAVKWVLGEQSVKSLRSEQMADVIFSGSSSRKAMGSAEVALYICNRDGTGARTLPIETDQVQISRRIYKNGESEYRINNKICRLKDIRELFMDTGIGTRAYSILEQGQIEQLLAASKIDRRAIFEEAAGISKYKAHKKEAVRRLERTEQNLLRLADILNEVTKRLRSVKLQAGKARSYLQYTQRLKELRVNYCLAEFDKINTAKLSRLDEIKQAEQQLAAITAQLAKKEGFINKLGQRIIEAQNQLNHTRNSLVTTESKIEQQLQRIEFLRVRITELQQRKTGAGQRLKKLAEQKNSLQAELKRIRDEQQRCERILGEKRQIREQVQEAIREISAECSQVSRELENEKSGIIDIVRKKAELSNEITSITAYRNNLSSQKDRLTSLCQTSQAELERLLAEKTAAKARASDIEKVLGELKVRLESNRKEAEEIGNQIDQDNKRLAAEWEARSAAGSELSILTDMEQSQEGLNNAVKSILLDARCVRDEKRVFDYVEAILADIIVTEMKYANAIEAALEGMAAALVINNTDKLLADKSIEKLEGRVNFIPMDSIEPFVDKEDLSKFPFVLGRAIEFVKYKTADSEQGTADGKKLNAERSTLNAAKYAPLVWKLLGKTIIVDSIDAAIKLARKLPDEYKFVTLKGQLLSCDRVIKVGPLGKRAGLITRKSRLRQLQQTINNINHEIAQLQKQIEKNSRTKEHLSKLCKELQESFYEANTEKLQINSKLSIIEQNIERAKKERRLITSEIDLLEAQITQSVQKEINCKQKLAELEAVEGRRTARIKELTGKLQEQKAQHQKLEEQLSELKVQLAEIGQHQQAAASTIARLTSQIQANRAAAEIAEEEIRNSKFEIQNSRKDILDCEAMVSELFSQKEKKQATAGRLHKEIEKLHQQQKQTEQFLPLKNTQKSEIEQKINQLKINLSQLEVKSDDLIERVAEELQIDLRKAYENYKAREIDWERIREEIEVLREKITRLGNVNVDAIEEQEDLEKRYNFLSSQVEDLKNSKANLQQLISRLNRKSREKFRATFEEIRVNFQQIFRKLFGGGKADILLEACPPESGEPDILEAGIEIIARPPGKETMSISLLSGGEKSLAAIALLFAVFKTKPSPFCFLDEIDAALDEANNERFNLLIREFTKDSQFIIITHAKRTMSMADELIGITMQIQGVSKKISVRFDQLPPDASGGQFDKVQEETAAVA